MTIPIVMINVGDPVGLGLITSLSRPGGNITGLSFTVGADTFGKALELLRDAVPSLRNVAVLSNPANPSHALVTRDVEVAARSLGVQVQSFEIRGPDEFDSAFAAMTKERVEALYVVADVQFVLHAARLAELAIKSRLPSMHPLEGWWRPGASYPSATMLPSSGRAQRHWRTSPEGAARRSPGRAAFQVRVCHQYEDRQHLGLNCRRPS